MTKSTAISTKCQARICEILWGPMKKSVCNTLIYLDLQTGSHAKPLRAPLGTFGELKYSNKLENRAERLKHFHFLLLITT